MIEKLRRSVLMISNGIDAEQYSEWENRADEPAIIAAQRALAPIYEESN